MTAEPLDQEKRTALLDKISALLAKTRVNGCTEPEAVAAMELAQKLMAKYGLICAELEAISSPVYQHQGLGIIATVTYQTSGTNIEEISCVTSDSQLMFKL
jgi:hypothetical protein